jgi:hypothetical protein
LQAADGVRRLGVRRLAGAWQLTGDADEFALHREMGCTRDDFVRWLPGATRFAPMQLTADKAVVHAGDATVEIALTQAPQRRIALVSIPVLQVSFRFSGAEASAYRDFMTYFDSYTKRGGG